MDKKIDAVINITGMTIMKEIISKHFIRFEGTNVH